VLLVAELGRSACDSFVFVDSLKMASIVGVGTYHELGFMFCNLLYAIK